jgi:hypothetical protein
MADLLGMQQVLQLTSTVERAQMASQSQTGQIAHAFEKEIDQINQSLREKADPAKAADGSTPVDDERAGGKGTGGRNARRRHGAKEEKESRQQELIAETGHGGLLDIRA